MFRIISLCLLATLVLGSRLFHPEIFRDRGEQQALLPLPAPVSHDNPRYSNSSFPGDKTGASPFFYCPESDPETDLFNIDTVVLNPNPPHINFVYVFHAHGYFREAILRTSFRVNATVKREDEDGLEFSYDADFCEFVSLMEMDGKSTICPPFKGYGTIHKVEFVDFGVAEGNYSLKIDVRSNDRRVFCIQSWFELTRTQLSPNILTQGLVWNLDFISMQWGDIGMNGVLTLEEWNYEWDDGLLVEASKQSNDSELNANLKLHIHEVQATSSSRF